MPSTDPDPGTTNQRHSASLSSLLLDTAHRFQTDRVRLADIIESLGKRSFGFILLIFALPNSLPVLGIPGVSTVTGLPLLLIALQMTLGHERAYLPGWIANRSIATADFQRLIGKVVPWLRRIEHLFKPRLTLLASDSAERWLGLCCAILAFVLVLPIPMGNLLPGVSILFIALGMIERDGLCILLGLGLGVTSVAVLGGLTWVILRTFAALIANLVGA